MSLKKKIKILQCIVDDLIFVASQIEDNRHLIREIEIIADSIDTIIESLKEVKK